MGVVTWKDEHANRAAELWGEGWSGPHISTKLKEEFSIDVGAPSIVSKMKRMKAPKGVRKRRHSRIETAVSRRSSTSAQRLVKQPLTVAVAPVLLIEAGDLTCHRVIGEVVRRGHSLVCNNPTPDTSVRFCRPCREELGIFEVRK